MGCLGTSFNLFWYAKPFCLLPISASLGFGLGFGIVSFSLDFISFALDWVSRAFCLTIISLSFWLMDSVLLSVDKNRYTIC